jgi:putative acetyltransferase
MTGFSIIPACSDADLIAIDRLFREYGESLDFNLCFQGFEDELASLPGKYAPPTGCLLLARSPEGEAAGCVAVRAIYGDDAEMKRLYVRPQWRVRALGRTLADHAVAFARKAGYVRLRPTPCRRR